MRLISTFIFLFLVFTIRMKVKLFYTLSISLIFLFGCSVTKKVGGPDLGNIALKIHAESSDLTKKQLKTWAHADLQQDSIPGISLAKAYAYLKGRENTSVIVAIMDSGLDIEHEDLRPVLWTNKEEIADGKDNDNNGFVDDIHGWNFLGDTYNENLEMTRMVRNYQEEFANKTVADIAPDRMEDFKLYEKLAKEVASNYNENLEMIRMFRNYQEEFDYKTVADIAPDRMEDFKLYEKLAKEVASKFSGSEHYFNVGFNAREGQPDPYQYNEKVYGDNKVEKTVWAEAHASHVGGIVAAVRGNGKGIDGIADNVQLMPLRVVPKGDEYDKDVALGIRYAVDNGAKIINASFGKEYSPNKEWVYEAIKYAAEKDVLIVLAAGNNGQNIDIHAEFPNDTPDGENEIADNVLMVGATTYEYNESLPAAFSNYGKRNVDVFAPGYGIYSTVPGNRYHVMDGTSMAAPAVSGVAALLRSYFPKLTAAQVKQIIMKSGTKIDFKVHKPGGEPTLVPFTDLCVYGRILNAYNAVVMAGEMIK